MASLLLQELGLHASLQINSLGCAGCRPAFNRALLAFLDQNSGALCPDCDRRRHTNPLRVLDCKSVHCQEKYIHAPAIIDYLCTACRDHFHTVEQGLTTIDIPYQVNPLMVRGLDYYTRTTFELLTDALGARARSGPVAVMTDWSRSWAVRTCRASASGSALSGSCCCCSWGRKLWCITATSF